MNKKNPLGIADTGVDAAAKIDFEKISAAVIETEISGLKEKIKNYISGSGKKLSEVGDIIGIAPNNLSNFMTGRLSFSPKKLIEIGKILGL